MLKIGLFFIGSMKLQRVAQTSLHRGNRFDDSLRTFRGAAQCNALPAAALGNAVQCRRINYPDCVKSVNINIVACACSGAGSKRAISIAAPFQSNLTEGRGGIGGAALPPSLPPSSVSVPSFLPSASLCPFVCPDWRQSILGVGTFLRPPARPLD